MSRCKRRKKKEWLETEYSDRRDSPGKEKARREHRLGRTLLPPLSAQKVINAKKSRLGPYMGTRAQTYLDLYPTQLPGNLWT